MGEAWLVLIHELPQHDPEVHERVQPPHGHGGAVDQLEPVAVQRGNGGGKECCIVGAQHSS